MHIGIRLTLENIPIQNCDNTPLLDYRFPMGRSLKSKESIQIASENIA